MNLDKSKDTRKLFDRYTRRKPSSFHDVDIVGEFCHDQIEALRAMPFIGMDNDPMFGTFDSSPLIQHVLDSGTCEFVLRLPDNRFVPEANVRRYFYVNTEGYDYCRYVFEIDPAWVNVIFL